MFHAITQVVNTLNQAKNRPNCQGNAGENDAEFPKHVRPLCHDTTPKKRFLGLFLQELTRNNRYMLAPACSCCKRFFNSISRASEVVRGKGIRTTRSD